MHRIHNEHYDVYVNSSYLTSDTIDAAVEFSRKSGTPFPLKYDTVINCLGMLVGGAMVMVVIFCCLLLRTPICMLALLDVLLHRLMASGNQRPPRYFFPLFIRQHAMSGWVMDLEMFDISALPQMQDNGKFPTLTETYESTNVPGLYFAGVLSHGKDYQRSAGGFIHGFRYTARALSRILAQRHRQAPWGAQQRFTAVNHWLPGNGLHPGSHPQSPTDGFGALLHHLFRRIDTASGPYQMVSVLGDGAVFSCPDGENVEATYLEELPLDYFAKTYKQ